MNKVLFNGMIIYFMKKYHLFSLKHKKEEKICWIPNISHLFTEKEFFKNLLLSFFSVFANALVNIPVKSIPLFIPREGTLSTVRDPKSGQLALKHTTTTGPIFVSPFTSYIIKVPL